MQGQVTPVNLDGRKAAAWTILKDVVKVLLTPSGSCNDLSRTNCYLNFTESSNGPGGHCRDSSVGWKRP
jgi:hypothetical protein